MRYIGTPFRISLPGIPQPADGAVPTAGRTDGEVQMPETLNISGVSTSETSADRAKREAEALLRECQERVVAGHRICSFWIMLAAGSIGSGRGVS